MFSINMLSKLKRSRVKYLIHLPGDYNKSSRYLRHWSARFLRSSVKFSVLVRDYDFYLKIKEELRFIDFVYAKSPLDVEGVISEFPSLKTIVYLNNFAMNIHTLRFNNYEHVFIGNKNTDLYSIPTNYYKAYDSIYVSGCFAMDKFKESNVYSSGVKFESIGVDIPVGNCDSNDVSLVISDGCLVDRSLYSTLMSLVANGVRNVTLICNNKIQDRLRENIIEFEHMFDLNIFLTNEINSLLSKKMVIVDYENVTLDHIYSGSPLYIFRDENYKGSPKDYRYFFSDLPFVNTVDGRANNISIEIEKFSRSHFDQWKAFLLNNFDPDNFAGCFGK
ncbi:hypothetical protein [Vibrio panuliri]|uniref:Uncharacterized protein n=1 Tax=Vibrio panuliri TaxID=1381081 RepID=A0ABX3FRR5_9VIBR|nr:hypothetical protein [Vibrio panuliri]KAB1457285.1 hypothetical protein F7O85_05980 [Vibrio panuliri]OLQ95133.1 hypothetical protein BIY20_21455 [Vibrio panuliri]